MAQLCLLHGMLLLSSLVCQDIANIWAGAEILELRNTSTDSFVSPDTPPVLCGRRPEMRKPINASDVDDGLEKIIGGRLARHGQYPWTVNIRARTVNNGVVTYGQVCGGAIINEYWVLTAAHCKRVGNETSLSIVVGDFDRQIKDEGEQKFLVDKFIPHQRYTGKGVVDYNIALIKVANTSDGRGIRFNDYVQPICLPNPGQKCLLDDFLVVTGWGAECATHKTRSIRHLKSVHLRCKTKKFCRRNIYSRLQITDRMFCAGAKYSEQDVCDGDLGGPGALRRANLFILIGVMSHGTLCQKRNFPVIFSSVSAYLPWIEKTIANYSNFGEGTIPGRRVKLTEATLSTTNETLLE
ncbi:hypothetical protein BsWGS_27128 [Bradybaena similaris]